MPLSPDVRLQIMKTDHSQILDRHGVRSTGDNLTGFRCDIEILLSDSGLFDWVEIQQASTRECMISVVCKMKPGYDCQSVASCVEKIWNDSLRYPTFERHEIEIEDECMAFHFVTASTGLGVCGIIECRR